MTVIVLNKKVGETPLACLNRYRHEAKIGADVPMSYAGRLDPLASGLMLVLVGDEDNRQEVRERYLGHEKEYTFGVLFGVSTDTYDLLGLVCGGDLAHKADFSDIDVFLKKVEGEALSMKGTWQQPYPPFSSRPVNGKSLFQWAKEGRLAEISIPTIDVEIVKIEMLGRASLTLEDTILTGDQVLGKALDAVGSVTGDFRQQEIAARWRQWREKISRQSLSSNSDFSGSSNSCPQFPCIQFRVRCTSGTYVRAIAHELGVRVGVPALAFGIVRERVGDFILEAPRKGA